MKIFLILILSIFSINSFSQNVKKEYDKFENKFYLSLEDDFDLTVEHNTETLDFDLNILKIYNSKDTSYFVKLILENMYNWICSSIESKCVLSIDNENIILKSANYDKNKRFMKVNFYNFDLPIEKTELIKILNSNNITVKYICDEGEMKGTFNEDEINELKAFIKLYVGK